jgi:hypothetical protein
MLFYRWVIDIWVKEIWVIDIRVIDIWVIDILKLFCKTFPKLYLKFVHLVVCFGHRCVL